MPKQAKSSTAKVRQICQEYLDEFSATPARDLRCNLCDVLVKCDKKFFVESHRKSKQHQRKLETKSKSQSKQNLFTTRSSKLQGTGCLFILSCKYLTSKTEPSFFKVSVCYNAKSIAFGDWSQGMCC